MPTYTLQQLNDLSVKIQTDFQISFEEANKLLNWAAELSLDVTTNKRTLVQKFVHDYAQFKERNIGSPPEYKELTGDYATFELKEYGDGVRINAYDISEDDEGLYLAKAAELGKAAGRFQSQQAADILSNGHSAASYPIYDGKAFFANDHPKQNGGVIDNLLAGTLDVTSYQAARVAMQRFVSDLNTSATVYGAKPTHTIIPPDLEVTLAQILNNSLLPVATYNTENVVLKGSSKPIVEPRLADTNDWYVMTTELGVKPFLWIKHRDYGDLSRVDAQISDSDECFRNARERRWWTFALLLLWPTRPETAIKVMN